MIHFRSFSCCWNCLALRYLISYIYYYHIHHHSDLKFTLCIKRRKIADKKKRTYVHFVLQKKIFIKLCILAILIRYRIQILKRNRNKYIFPGRLLTAEDQLKASEYFYTDKNISHPWSLYLLSRSTVLHFPF
jgi:hypothetical protein